MAADLTLPPALQANVTDYLGSGRAVRRQVCSSHFGDESETAVAVAVGLALPGIETAGFDPNIPS